MAKVFRPSNRESKLLSKIESSRERSRRRALHGIKDCLDSLSNAIAMKLVESSLIETVSKNSLQEQLAKTLETLSRADDFDVDYKIAPMRNLVQNPHVVSIYLTVIVLEDLINHPDIIDVFGSDEDIYQCINQQVLKHLPD